MSFATFFGLSVVFWVVIGGAALVAVGIYLAKRGVFKTFGDAAVDAVKQDVTDAADKLK